MTSDGKACNKGALDVDILRYKSQNASTCAKTAKAGKAHDTHYFLAGKGYTESSLPTWTPGAKPVVCAYYTPCNFSRPHALCVLSWIILPAASSLTPVAVTTYSVFCAELLTLAAALLYMLLTPLKALAHRRVLLAMADHYWNAAR